MSRSETRADRAERNQQRSLEVFVSAKAGFDAQLAELAAMSAEHFGADSEAVLWEQAEMLRDWTARLRDLTEPHRRDAEGHGPALAEQFGLRRPA